MAERSVFHNTGDFRGAAIFQGSTIHNAGQIAGTIVNADAAAKADLKKLLEQLGVALKAVPPEKVEEAEAMGAAAEDLVKEAAKEQPNQSRLRQLGGVLAGAARAVGAAAPAAIDLANKLIDLVGKISGAGGGAPLPLPPTLSV